MSLPELLNALRDPARYPHPVDRVELIETHISAVLLAGGYAYKLKKPVDFGFLDFSTLARRKHCCEEELRLNGRLAPQLYLAVVPICGTPANPQLGGDGEPFEYAVKMRRFDVDALLATRLAEGRLAPELMDTLARRLADFHASCARAPADGGFGGPEQVLAPMRQNVEQLGPRLQADDDRRRLARLGAWIEAQAGPLGPRWAARRREGFIRECHGDLHLGNIALWQGQALPFDGIEFNPQLCWIDVISELAFVTMDLDYRGAPALGMRLLNGWLAHSGDYAGLALLRSYQLYRAMVRAKVAALTAEGSDDPAPQWRDCSAYLRLAEDYTRAAAPRLLLTCGLSGSGKSVLASALGEAGCIHLRSDVERKRLVGLTPEARSDSPLDGGLYSADMGERTYARLAALADGLLAAGWPVVVDATFLRREQRRAFAELARRHGIPAELLQVEAAEEVLRARLLARQAAGGDPSEAGPEVLDGQLAGQQPIDDDEGFSLRRIDSSADGWLETARAELARAG